MAATDKADLSPITVVPGQRSGQPCIRVAALSCQQGWTKVEFNSILTRELIEEKRPILPIWFEVSKKDIFDYSPSLSDRFAAIWDGRAADTARKLYPSLTDSGGWTGLAVKDPFIPG
jgi:hypothetical protein